MQWVTEIDKDSLLSANNNVNANNLQEMIEVREVVALPLSQYNNDNNNNINNNSNNNNNNRFNKDAAVIKQPYPILKGVVKSAERYDVCVCVCVCVCACGMCVCVSTQ